MRIEAELIYRAIYQKSPDLSGGKSSPDDAKTGCGRIAAVLI